MNYEQKQVVVDGILTSYFDVGTGPTIVLLHGWLDSKETFATLMDELSRKYRCIALDLPNFGSSQESDRIINLFDYSKFVRSFLYKLDVSRYCLLGHSMGGQISIFGTAEEILMPSRLILLAAAGVRDEEKFKKSSIKYASKLLKRIVPKPIKSRAYKLLKSDYDPSLSIVHKKIINAVLNTDIQKNALKLHVPTLLVYGSDDIHTTLSMGTKLNKHIKGSKLVILDGQDHWLHKKASDIIAIRIAEFM